MRRQTHGLGMEETNAFWRTLTVDVIETGVGIERILPSEILGILGKLRRSSGRLQ